MASYPYGSTVHLRGTFCNRAGAKTDPTTITLKVKAPAGTISTYTYAAGQLTKAEVGVYYREETMSAAGTWYYRFEGTGDNTGVGEANLTIEATNV